jgi:hypothetical protein
VDVESDAGSFSVRGERSKLIVEFPSLRVAWRTARSCRPLLRAVRASGSDTPSDRGGPIASLRDLAFGRGGLDVSVRAGGREIATVRGKSAGVGGGVRVRYKPLAIFGSLVRGA